MRLKKMTEATRLFVLASMTRPDHTVDARELARIHRTQGYSKIAVHYVIERDGTVQPGRELDEPGCLAARFNTSAIQVCLIGGVDSDLSPEINFTPQQRESLTALVDKHGLPVVFSACCPLQEL